MAARPSRAFPACASISANAASRRAAISSRRPVSSACSALSAVLRRVTGAGYFGSAEGRMRRLVAETRGDIRTELRRIGVPSRLWSLPLLVWRLARRTRRAEFSRQTRRRLGGRQPLWGIGVTSRIEVTAKPTACNARNADSRPEPGPLTSISRVRMPCSMAFRPASSAATCAA